MLDRCIRPLRMAFANLLYGDADGMGWESGVAAGFAKACAGSALAEAA